MRANPFQKEILDSVHSILTSAYHSPEFDGFKITKETELIYPVFMDEKAKKAISKSLKTIIKAVQNNKNQINQ
jgi:two-component SAPR family response regulator